MLRNTVLDYLENTVSIVPDKAAIVADDVIVTFKELKNTAQIIGSKLAEKTKAFNRPVIVAVDRSEKSIIGFMGVLYSGNYYVPVDINAPVDRLMQMIDKLNPAAFIHFNMNETVSKLENKYQQIFHSYEDLVSDASLSATDVGALSTIKSKILDTNPCYVLFTSGSTGEPKGVVISHNMVIDLTEWLTSILQIDSDDSIGNQTPFFFDASVKDIYQMLKTGASLVIIKPQMFVFTKSLVEYLNDKRVSVILWASSAITMVANSGIFNEVKPRYLKVVTFAGEQLFTKNLNIWMDAIPEAKYINLYGPTEATVDCIYYEVDQRYTDDEIIPLGRPCFNKEVFLIDENNKIITNGIGEITVRGSGVGLGYYGDIDKSTQVYIQNPRHNLYRDIVYKTGDLAFYNEEGLFVFASRKDDQIKLNGHRIELGEIEFALSSIDGIDINACVFDKEKSVIVGFYSGREMKRKEIIKQLINRIPKYMIPSNFIYVKNIPLTKNGKVDRNALRSEFI